MQIAFLHPDLGLGGAERLVVDAAQALLRKGHKVTVFTSHYEKERSFAETHGMDVEVAGDWLPRHLFGRFHIFFATLRAFWLAIYVAWHQKHFHVTISDQISAYLIVLWLLAPGARRVFYCHFPDQLLAEHKTVLQQLYRWPFDMFEEWCTGFAHLILVNSAFTASMFSKTFPTLTSARGLPRVLYPCVDVGEEVEWTHRRGDGFVLLSINRFERKKGLDRALEGLAALRDLDEKLFDKTQLILAGGYDPRVRENVEYHQELKNMCKELDLDVEDVSDPSESDAKVVLVRSFSDELKRTMLQSATAVIYTPSNEHFGIVPLEAAAASRPVIAVASGGPLETVEAEAGDSQTGVLVPEPPTPKEWAVAIAQVLDRDGEKAQTLGQNARRRVLDTFSRDAFGNKLDAFVREA